MKIINNCKKKIIIGIKNLKIVRKYNCEIKIIIVKKINNL